MNVLGITDNNLPSLKIYPNPTNGVISIILDGTFDYVMMNLLGEIILTGQGTNSVNLDLTDINRGAYFITVYSENEKETLKIIKQ